MAVGIWLSGMVIGGVIGAALEWLILREFIQGLAFGIVLGHIVTYKQYLRLSLVNNVPSDPFRARLLRWALGFSIPGILLYLLAGWTGILQNSFYPITAIGFLVICIFSGLLLRRGQQASAAIVYLAWLLILIATVALKQGVTSPFYALNLIILVLGGLLLGRNGFSSFLIVIIVHAGLFGLQEYLGKLTVYHPAPDLAQVPFWVIFWWCTYAITSFLTWFFARNLEQALQTARGQTSTLARTLHAITEEPLLEKFLGQVLMAISSQLNAQYSALFLRGESGNTLGLHSAYLHGRISPIEQAANWLPVSALTQESGIWEELQQKKKPIFLDALSHDPRGYDRSLWIAQDAANALFVPLMMNDEVTGLICLYRSENQRYSDYDLELAQALVHQVTLAMQLTLLVEQGQKTAVLEERNRMAREIHDTLAQGFTGIIAHLEAAEGLLPESTSQSAYHLTRARDLARLNLAEARRSVWALRPQALERKGLLQNLRDLAGTIGSEMEVVVNVTGQVPSLLPEVESDLLRIAQEAITNAQRHSGAACIKVDLHATDAELCLQISDNGTGFDVDRVEHKEGQRFGLISMNERITRHGGKMTLRSQPGSGTEINFRLPMSPKEIK